jgi:hypothetical protein
VQSSIAYSQITALHPLSPTPLPQGERGSTSASRAVVASFQIASPHFRLPMNPLMSPLPLRERGPSSLARVFQARLLKHACPATSFPENRGLRSPNPAATHQSSLPQLNRCRCFSIRSACSNFDACERRCRKQAQPAGKKSNSYRPLTPYPPALNRPPRPHC